MEIQNNQVNQKGLPMSENPFQSFIDLIKLDQNIIVQKQQITDFEVEIKSVREQARSTTQTEQALKQKLHDAKKDVDEKELEIKDIEVQLKEKKARLDTVTNQREYKSVQTEIENFNAQQLALEDVLVQAWNTLENIQKDHDAKLPEFETQLSELEKKEEEIANKIEELKKDIQTCTEQRPEKEKIVPEEWLQKYVMMRERVSDPVVPILQGGCSACFYKTPDQDLILLKRNKLLQCKNCYRFLFFEKEAETLAEKAETSETAKAEPTEATEPASEGTAAEPKE